MALSVSLYIGGVEVRLMSEEEILLGERFTGFLSKGDASSILSLRISRRDIPVPPGSFSTSSVDVFSEDDLMVIERADFRGYISLDPLVGELEFSSEDSLESFLRIAYSLILPQDDGLAIHASSLARNGKAHIFPGRSGVGKTTIVTLSPDAILLTDEISIVRGIGKSPVAYGTPFYGDLRVPGENIRAAIAGIYFPVKDGENRLEPLSARSALERLLPSVVFFGQDQDLMRRVFHLTCDLVESVPCYDLHFVPEPSFWGCIDERERGA